MHLAVNQDTPAPRPGTLLTKAADPFASNHPIAAALDGSGAMKYTGHQGTTAPLPSSTYQLNIPAALAANNQYGCAGKRGAAIDDAYTLATFAAPLNWRFHD